MEIPSIIKDLPSADKNRLREVLLPVISATAERIHYAEGRRGSFSVIAGVLFAGGLTLIAVGASQLTNLILLYSVVASAFSMVILGVAMWLLYSIQTNRYPFTGATNTWKWFYRDALPEQKKFDFSWLAYLRFSSEKKRIESEYGRQLPLYFKKIGQLRNENEDLVQDIQQLYVLHVNEKYKNIHLTHLRQLTHWGLMLVLIVAAGFAGLGAFFDAQNHRPLVSHQSNSHIEVTVTWRRLSDGPTDDERWRWLVNVTLRNKQNKAVLFKGIRAIDPAGMDIPVKLLSSSWGSTIIPAQYTVQTSNIVAVPNVTNETIVKLEVAVE